MIKSELIERIAKQARIDEQTADKVVNALIKKMFDAIAKGERIEVRGFGSFSVKSYQPKIGRNPRTGERVSIPVRHRILFKAGLELKNRVQN